MSSFLPEKNLYDSGFSNFIKLFSTSISYPLSLNGIEGIKRVFFFLIKLGFALFILFLFFFKCFIFCSILDSVKYLPGPGT